NDNQSNKGKHTITPPTSPRPEKMVKSPEPNNEDEYDPMELIELNPIEESSNNIPNPPTYAQITKQILTLNQNQTHQLHTSIWNAYIVEKVIKIMTQNPNLERL